LTCGCNPKPSLEAAYGNASWFGIHAGGGPGVIAYHLRSEIHWGLLRVSYTRANMRSIDLGGRRNGAKLAD
jgi:hypothetical protein